MQHYISPLSGAESVVHLLTTYPPHSEPALESMTKQNTNSTSDVNSGPILHFQILFEVLFLLYKEDLTFETFVANNIKRSILSHLFDDQLHHISVLEACITRIKLNMVIARNCCQLQFNLASTNLQPKAFL
jgi:hypothetical protein